MREKAFWWRDSAAFCGKEELLERQKEKVQELLEEIKKESEGSEKQESI